ncbi:diguanylate cyclase domain-containing protein [Agathobacter sp. LCP21S3_B2]|uniref:diguanylate cyclase domain-containing protein n=1 Tax=Agathobacter sp. LCP21S3_B2 TaxID=3438734 RepID=UPI003F8F916E
MKKRAVVGVLVAGIADNFTVQTCRGVIQAARDKDIDVVIMPGKYIERDLTSNREIMYEYQYNTLYSYAAGGKVDAIIVLAGSICCYTTLERTKAFLEQYKDTPCVLMGCKIDGYLSVNYDNYLGIKQGVDYLVTKLGCRNIAMMGGPDDNTDALERKHTFLDTLKSYDIPIGEETYFCGNLTKAQREQFGMYIDRHPDIEAVVCVNDDTALSFYEAMMDKGLVPGQDIYVMGYDNTIVSAKAKPALTTVMADASSLGGRAIELLLDLLDGKDVESVVVTTRLIKRDSFGSMKSHQRSIQVNRLDREYIDYYYDEIFYRYTIEVNDNRLRILFRTIMELVIDYYDHLGEMNSDDGTLIRLLNTFLHMGALKYADAENLLTHIDEVYQLLLSKYEGDVAHSRIISVISSVYRELVISEEQIQGDMLEQSDKKNYDMKTFVTASMQFESGADQNYAVLLQRLSWLGIENADLYIFAQPIMHLDKEEFVTPNHVYLMASLRKGEVKNTRVGRKRRRTSDIFRGSIFEYGGNVKVVFPIFSNENLYGLFLCDMSEQIYNNGEFVVGQLGSAAKMLHMLKVNQDIQNEYERTLVALKENNIALDALAKSDGLTGILNRRGFMEAAEKRLMKNRANNIVSLVGYVDMNNLKIVNDRYGHDEGDFSIQHISNTLDELFKDGVVGRLGGDEFGIICDYDGNEDGNDIVAKIYKSFNDFNMTSDKPYNVTVAVGVYCVAADSYTELQEALGFADEKLYVEKQHRVKNVAK